MKLKYNTVRNLGRWSPIIILAIIFFYLIDMLIIIFATAALIVACVVIYNIIWAAMKYSEKLAIKLFDRYFIMEIIYGTSHARFKRKKMKKELDL